VVCQADERSDFDAVSAFIAANARVIDRRRFGRMFGDGDAQRVRDAVAAYRNHDGGFGDALEPGLRDPASAVPGSTGGVRAFNWPAWSPAAEREWRGFLTVDALRILRANRCYP